MKCRLCRSFVTAKRPASLAKQLDLVAALLTELEAPACRLTVAHQIRMFPARRTVVEVAGVLRRICTECTAAEQHAGRRLQPKEYDAHLSQHKKPMDNPVEGCSFCAAAKAWKDRLGGLAPPAETPIQEEEHRDGDP